MKCPKCGYNSFEYLDSCKKCKNDLTAFKQAHGIRSAASPAVAAAPAMAAAAIAAAAPLAENETFTWEEPAAAPPPSSPVKPGDDIFAAVDLDFAATPPAAPATPQPLSFDLEPAATTAPAVPPKAEEIGLADFSFDEPAPETAAAPPPLFGSEPADDDGFASLLETGDSSEETAAAPAPAATPELESAWEAPANVFGGFDEERNASPAPAAGETGEIGLESFGWEEETPAPAQQPPKGPQVELDGFSPAEFDSLFGGPDKQ